MQRRHFLTLGLATPAFGLLSGCSQSQPPSELHADYPYYADLTALAAASDIVARVRVNANTGQQPSRVQRTDKSGNVTIEPNPDLPLTVFAVTVQEVFKAEPGQHPTALKVGITGGELPDGTSVVEADLPPLEVGADYVLFLDNFSKSPQFRGLPLLIIGGAQGQFRVVDDQLVGEGNLPRHVEISWTTLRALT